MVAEIVDELITGRALVFGSLPPEGRDLDLLVRPEEEARLSQGLRDADFTSHGATWVRFEACTAMVVDLVPVSEWGLPAAEEEDLFAQARQIGRLQHLVRPAPHHLLLIVARRIARGTPLDQKRRGYIEAALSEDARAWERAQRCAPSWRATQALTSLRSSFERRDAESTRNGAGRLHAFLSRRRRRGAVVAISGLDGAGKSSQAEALIRALDRLGIDAVTEWTRLTRNRSLDLIARPVKWVLRRVGSRRRTAEPSIEREAEADPGRALRGRSALVTHIWTGIVAVANALTQRRATAGHLRRGCVVVCDRYTLDSAVHLRWLYGLDRSFGFQTAVVRRLSPTPVCSFFLDVPPEIAFDRKPDFDLEELKAQASLYQALYPTVGAIRIDGELPREEICALIASEVWRALN
jgi:thymidylate kinase